jgi:hypothetical protein
MRAPDKQLNGRARRPQVVSVHERTLSDLLSARSRLSSLVFCIGLLRLRQQFQTRRKLDDEERQQRRQDNLRLASREQAARTAQTLKLLAEQQLRPSRVVSKLCSSELAMFAVRTRGGTLCTTHNWWSRLVRHLCEGAQCFVELTNQADQQVCFSMTRLEGAHQHRGR